MILEAIIIVDACAGALDQVIFGAYIYRYCTLPHILLYIF